MVEEYSKVLIRLLQGVIYNQNKELWDILLTYRLKIEEYFSKIGVTLLVFESEGYAFLKQKDDDELSEEEDIPSLFVKRQLSYPVTLLCVLLVEKLIQEENRGGGERIIVNIEEIRNMMKIFLPEKNNEAKIIDSVETYINKLVDYGFLKKLKSDRGEYEIKRILKAKITADRLVEIKDKLVKYAAERI